MIEREGGALVKDIRTIITELEELKTTQLVGNSQIEIRHIDTGSTLLRFTTTPNASNQNMTAMGKAKVSITCDAIQEPNALIAYCLPEVHADSPTGALVGSSGVFPRATIFNAKPDNYKNAKWNIQVFDVSMTGSPISSRAFYVKFHFWVSCKNINFEWGTGNYE